MLDPEKIAAAHVRRLAAWDIPTSEDYTREVVERARASPGPELHHHAHYEMGMCLECDAASALRDALGSEEDQ